jgi:hypothetical protein
MGFGLTFGYLFGFNFRKNFNMETVKNKFTGYMSGTLQQNEIEDFFDRYERRFNLALSEGKADIDETVNSFTSDFIEASPAGVVAGKNDKKFREALSKGWAFYKEIGIDSMDILSKQINILDQFHAIVKIRWNSLFTRKDTTKGEIAFDVFYLVQKREDIRIFAYITGNEQQALKDAGLI